MLRLLYSVLFIEMQHLFLFLSTILPQLSKFGIAASILFSFSIPASTTSPDSYKISSADGEFEMEVMREGQEVKIIIHFRDASQYSHALIEKTDELKNEFRQCAYIDMSEVKGGAIEKRDKYPRMYNASYYRLRTVSKEGIERTYPGVRLPEKTQ